MSTKSWEGDQNWQNSLGGLRNTVRQELVARQLAQLLPEPSEEVSVLDVGCGQGTQLINLAHKGYSATGIDISLTNLSLAKDRLSAEKQTVQERVKLIHGDIHNLGSVVDKAYDVVLCHGVIMYMPSLEQSLGELSEVVASNGILSTLTRNMFSITMRAGMKGQYKKVVSDIDNPYYTNGLEVEQVRGDEPAEIAEALTGLGFKVLNWYGVRLFTDHLPDTPIPENIGEILAAEELIAKRDPYRQLCALTHFISQKD